MKNATLLALLSSTYLASAWAARPMVIYGVDNRQEVYEASAAHQLLARSTAIMIPKTEIEREASNPGVVQLSQLTLKDWLESMAEEEDSELLSKAIPKAVSEGFTFCPQTRFIDQPNPGSCSGFLIAPDLIVTAGHCVEEATACADNEWVFDFNLDKETQSAGIDVKEENVYRCKKVVSHALVEMFGLDYGVIQLDRKVKGRTPLEIRSEGKVPDQQGVLVIGGPSGLPTKVATGARVRSNGNLTYFSANLDTFEGNSGSAVFNADSGVVEGILVRGEEDYVPNIKKMCVEVYTCQDNTCRGEDVSRMSSVPEVANQKGLYAAAEAGNIKELEAILAKKIWVDFYTKDGQSALIKASGRGQVESVKYLLSKGADANLQDAAGNSALHALAKVLNEENAETLSALIAAGANLEAQNDQGETPLMVASRLGNDAAEDILISAGADDKLTRKFLKNFLPKRISFYKF